MYIQICIYTQIYVHTYLYTCIHTQLITKQTMCFTSPVHPGPHPANPTRPADPSGTSSRWA